MNDAFVLKVDMAAGTNYPRQTFTKYNDGLIVSRTYEPDSQSWLSDVTYARESDLSNYVKIVDLSNSISLNANAGGIVSIPITVPSGYKYVGIIDSFAEGYAIVTINKYFEDNSVKVNVRNLNQETVTNMIHAKILCAKS